MAEIITLTSAIDPPRTVFRVAMLAFDWEGASIKVRLKDWDGLKFGDRTVSVNYAGAEAVALMTSLNKANLSTQSLHQRVITKLVADGKLPAGTSSGSPD